MSTTSSSTTSTSTDASVTAAASRWSRFAAWRHQRPFVGGLLTALAGVELFFSGQLDLKNIHIQVGIEGLQATLIPVIMVVLGILSMTMPVHRMFYGLIALALSVYSLIGVNLGGFFIGMLLGVVGGILVVSWLPKKADASTPDDSVVAPLPFAQRRQ